MFEGYEQQKEPEKEDYSPIVAPGTDFLHLRREEFLQEKKVEESSHIMEGLLNLFGTDEAREKFLSLCRDYNKIVSHKSPYKREGEVHRKIVAGINEGRATIHNQIMDTLQRLSSSQKQGSKGEKVFEKLTADRNKVAEVIKDYFSSTDH